MAGLRYAVALAVLASLSGIALAQIPSLGWCPEYVPMADFSMERYLGTWYEAERYFTVLEAGSRCVSTNYTKAVDGRVLVSNQITNRLTGIKRVVEGEIRNVVKGAESKLNVKYSTLPVPFETTYSVLDSDYDSYAVVYSCSSIGPLRTQNAWVMTRERLAPGTVLQMAYGVLDKYKISRTFFVKTDQADCAIAEAAAAEREQAERKAAALAAAQEAVAEKSAAPLPSPVAAPVPAPVAVPAPAPIPVAAAAAEAVPVAAAEPIVPAIPIIPSVVAAPVAAAPVQADAPAFVPLPIALAEKPVEIIPAPVAAPVVPVAAIAAADPVAVPEAPLEAAKPPKPAVVPEVAAPAPVAAEPVKAL